MSNFKKAAKLRLRFPSSKGMLSVEDLYQLPLTSKTGFDLDTVAKEVNAQLTFVSEESFVATTVNPQKAELTLKLDILKEVIADKIAENADKAAATAKRHEREKLLEVLQGKKDAALQDLPIEELEARIAALT